VPGRAKKLTLLSREQNPVW